MNPRQIWHRYLLRLTCSAVSNNTYWLFHGNTLWLVNWNNDRVAQVDPVSTPPPALFPLCVLCALYIEDGTLTTEY
jgi:hypothetical protein